MTIGVRNISILDDGFRIVAECVRAVGHFDCADGIYRGQADANWEIRPTAFRKPFGITDKSRLRRWITEARRLGLPTARNYIEWMVLARHYGVPTPLLDWTSNPLIALYFACQSNDDDESDTADGVIYVRRRNDFKEFWNIDSIDAFLPRSEPALFDAGTMNNRSSAQDSLMTLHSPNCPIVSREDRLITVSARYKKEVIAALAQFGIVDSRLFADFTIAAQRYQRAESLRTFLEDDGTMAAEPAPDENEGRNKLF